MISKSSRAFPVIVTTESHSAVLFKVTQFLWEKSELENYLLCHSDELTQHWGDEITNNRLKVVHRSWWNDRFHPWYDAIWDSFWTWERWGSWEGFSVLITLCVMKFENSEQNQEMETKPKWQNKLDWMRNSKVAEIIWNQWTFFTVKEVSLYSFISILKAYFALNASFFFFKKKSLLRSKWQFQKKNSRRSKSPLCMFVIPSSQVLVKNNYPCLFSHPKYVNLCKLLWFYLEKAYICADITNEV